MSAAGVSSKLVKTPLMLVGGHVCHHIFGIMFLVPYLWYNCEYRYFDNGIRVLDFLEIKYSDDNKNGKNVIFFFKRRISEYVCVRIVRL